MKEVQCILCERMYQTETPEEAIHSCKKHDCLSLYEKRKAEEAREAQRNRSALFMKAGNRDFVGGPFHR